MSKHTNCSLKSISPECLNKQQGLIYLGLLFIVAMIGATFAVGVSFYSISQQRQREEELLFIGHQFRQAIASYYEFSPGTVKRYPSSLSELLKDNRYLSVRRHLRQIYRDPMTDSDLWGLIRSPEGGIMGVHTLSDRTPLKTAGFRLRDAEFTQKRKYADWQFIYRPTGTSRH